MTDRHSCVQNSPVTINLWNSTQTWKLLLVNLTASNRKSNASSKLMFSMFYECIADDEFPLQCSQFLHQLPISIWCRRIVVLSWSPGSDRCITIPIMSKNNSKLCRIMKLVLTREWRSSSKVVIIRLTGRFVGNHTIICVLELRLLLRLIWLSCLLCGVLLPVLLLMVLLGFLLRFVTTAVCRFVMLWVRVRSFPDSAWYDPSGSGASQDAFRRPPVGRPPENELK